MTNMIVALVLLVILCAAAWYIYKEKKSGAACIGCPHSKQCSGGCGGSCQSQKEKSE